MALSDFEDDDYVLRVRALLSPDPDAHAQAEDDGIALSPLLFTDYAPKKIRRVRLGFLIHEEIAHHVLGKAGVPHGGLGTVEVFVQEAFAHWYWVSTFVSRGLISESMLRFPSIPTVHGHYQLGCHLGAALAGVRKSTKLIEEWKGRAVAPKSLKCYSGPNRN